MAAIDNSLAFKTDFLLVFAETPNVEFFCQDVIMPTLSIGELRNSIPWIDYPSAGDKLQYTPLTVTFVVDENYQNYLEIYNWFMQMRPPHQDYGGKDIVKDAILVLQNNNKNAKLRVTFVDAWPSAIDGLQFSTSAQGDDPQVVNLTLNYSYFTIEYIN